MVEKLRRGRPPGAPQDRRAQITAAAKVAFAELGYDRASIREIAQRASVDPKLVVHYFGTKPQLFAETMDVPPQSLQAVEILKVTPRKQWGEAMANFLMTPDGRVSLPPLVGVLRSAASDDKVAKTIREFYIKASMNKLLVASGIDHPQERAAALSPLLAGFVFADQILEIPIKNRESANKRRKLFISAVQAILTSELD